MDEYCSDNCNTRLGDVGTARVNSGGARRLLAENVLF